MYSLSMKSRLWLLVGAMVLVVAVVIIGLVANQKGHFATSSPSSTLNVTTSSPQSSQKDGPPLLIKHLGINLDIYDSTTQKAGDIVFTKTKLGEFDMPFFDFGFSMPANSAGPAKKNPQPTFIVPLGTKVHSIVDGVVVKIEKLYSDDYSIMVAKSKNDPYVYETEHVINPIVKLGDTVKAGDVVAEVSDYDSRNMPGYGLVEIGILKGGNPPIHICPFAYLDSSIKSTVAAKLDSLYKGWNAYRGKTVYDPTTFALPGCIDLDPVEG